MAPQPTDKAKSTELTAANPGMPQTSENQKEKREISKSRSPIESPKKLNIGQEQKYKNPQID
jgi:hypothetical protein